MVEKKPETQKKGAGPMKLALDLEVVEISKNNKNGNSKKRDRTYLVFKEIRVNGKPALVFEKEVKARNLKKLAKQLDTGEYVVFTKNSMKKLVVSE